MLWPHKKPWKTARQPTLKNTWTYHCIFRYARLQTTVTQMKFGNRRITITETAMEMKISAGSAHAEELHCRKVYARWIPRRLTPDTKE
ncbi:hypothetical protein Cfor_06515 [Coptotermes formosanus]|uniref:Uncharacterized protein n=1 Tax=Coptotermes formosanus TaxID=36987 RepID=A0A6L2Q6C3_COPFO|nr:hypothetical protein Cfor_06515 [Coptotermes formosanus]